MDLLGLLSDISNLLLMQWGVNYDNKTVNLSISYSTSHCGCLIVQTTNATNYEPLITRDYTLTSFYTHCTNYDFHLWYRWFSYGY